MFKVTMLITFSADADDRARAALVNDLVRTGGSDPRCILSSAGATLPRSSNGGDVCCHLLFCNGETWRSSDARRRLDALETDRLVTALDVCGYTIDRWRAPEPGLVQGVYRALFLAAKDCGEEVRARFEADLAAMPQYIPEIRNWAISRVEEARGARSWTHVWEQEFRQHADLTGPYMSSPYHWGYVDRWFDPEHQDFLADQRICHSASTLTASVMAHYGCSKDDRS